MIETPVTADGCSTRRSSILRSIRRDTAYRTPDVRRFGGLGKAYTHLSVPLNGPVLKSSIEYSLKHSKKKNHIHN